MAECHRQLQNEFPGILQLPGLFRPQRKLKGLQVAVDVVEWNPLGPGCGGGGFGVDSIPELDITGAEDDYTFLLEGLKQGTYPLQTLPGLEDLPFLRLPVRLNVSQARGRMEAIEQWISDATTKEMVGQFETCVRDKSEAREKRMDRGRHTVSGTHLDTNRLVDSVIARRVGIQPRLFRKPASVLEPSFIPDQHLVVFCFDVTLGVHKPLHDWLDEDKNLGKMLSTLLTAYEHLGVDCIVVGYADRFVTLPDGKVGLFALQSSDQEHRRGIQ